MKISQAVIFFGIVSIIYGIINYYITKRVMSVIPESYKTATLAILIFVIASFIVGRILENFWISYLSDVLVWIGSFWIAIMFYTLMWLVLIDIFRVVNHFFPFFPSIVKTNPENIKRTLALIISIFVFIVIAAGFINTKIINVRKYHLAINKEAGSLKSLNIVMASDLHLGTIYGKQFAYKLAWMINELKPDIILLAGDIIDEDIEPVLADNVGDALLKLNAKYGIYGITGNHEYIGGVKEAVDYLTAHNVKMLRDTSVLIDNSFYVVGREDRAIKQFSESKRKPLNEIVRDIDFTKPVIMMDHQPFNLEQAQQNGIDLQLSGHTHNGQLWPANYIVDKIYEVAWGYKLINKTHYYVSCGVGGWGPPVRTGSRPEIVNIKLRFAE